MARGMKVEGLDELIKKTEQMGAKPEGFVKRALWSGAGTMADALKAAVSSLPTATEKGKHRQHGVTVAQKAGLVKGLGISRMRSDGSTVSVIIGFAGENADGEKNATVMRRVESGTSWIQKIPTIRPTKNRTKRAAVSAMQKQFEEDLETFLTGG